jgi:hypothetical protein
MKTAREEVLLALTSSNRQSAELHRKRADKLLRKAVEKMQGEPERPYRWSLLRSE